MVPEGRRNCYPPENLGSICNINPRLLNWSLPILVSAVTLLACKISKGYISPGFPRGDDVGKPRAERVGVFEYSSRVGGLIVMERLN